MTAQLVRNSCSHSATIAKWSDLVGNTSWISVNRDCFREHCLLWCRPNIYIYIHTHIHTKYVAKVIGAEWKPIMRTSSRGDRWSSARSSTLLAPRGSNQLEPSGESINDISTKIFLTNEPAPRANRASAAGLRDNEDAPLGRKKLSSFLSKR